MSDILQGVAAFAVFGVIIYASACLFPSPYGVQLVVSAKSHKVCVEKSGILSDLTKSRPPYGQCSTKFPKTQGAKRKKRAPISRYFCVLRHPRTTRQRLSAMYFIQRSCSVKIAGSHCG